MPAVFTPVDVFALGEVLLRLDPGDLRVRSARQFTAWEGGGEYNVARGLRKCFGLRTGIITALADNEIGRLIEDLILQGGVNADHIHWSAYDGMGKKVRNPINFTERGFGIRGAKGCVDRGHSAASQLKAGDFNWTELLQKSQCLWLHTGGIFAGLSETTAEVVLEACAAAKNLGIKVSYDLNYRASLWQERGGFQAAQALNHRIAPFVDVMFGVLSTEEPNALAPSNQNDPFAERQTSLQAGIERMLQDYPNLQTVAATMRNVHNASRNDWGALLWQNGHFYRSTDYLQLDLQDRIGGGDGFVAGVLYGMLQQESPQQCVNLGVAHGALAMTTPGDTSMATLTEVLNLVQGGTAKVQR